jgi:hypothetical protein
VSSEGCEGWVGAGRSDTAGAQEPLDELARAVASGPMLRKDCRCIRSTGDNRICVHACCSGRPCRGDKHCRANEICMVTDCCGTDFQCVTVCNAPRPGYCFRPQTAASASGF